MVTLLESRLEAVRELCRRHHVKTLEAFGSAVTGAFNPTTSDLDFLVQFDPIPVHDYADNYFDLKDELEQLFARPVDLVEAAPLSNPYFIAAIRPTRTSIYAS
jgi:predicted nucleotidyltransferase